MRTRVSRRDIFSIYSHISTNLFFNNIDNVFFLISLSTFLFKKWEIYNSIILFCTHGDKSKVINLNISFKLLSSDDLSI